MKPGDMVRHKLSGERLMITKVNKRAVSGIWIDRPKEVPLWKRGHSEKESQKAVCLIENLELE